MIWAGLQALSLSSKIAICTTLAAALFSSGLYMGHQIGVSGCYEAQIKAQAHSSETGIKQAVVSDQTVKVCGSSTNRAGKEQNDHKGDTNLC